MVHKRKLIFTICIMVMVLSVGIVGIFAATDRGLGVSATIVFNPAAGGANTDIAGTCKVTITGGATLSNGTTAVEDYSPTALSFSYANSSPATGTFDNSGTARYFSYNLPDENNDDIEDGEIIIITVVTTITNSTRNLSKESRVKYTASIDPVSLSNVGISQTHTLKIGTGSETSFTTQVAGTGKVTVAPVGTASTYHVYTSTFKLRISDFGYDVTSTSFTVTVGVTTTTDAVN